MKWITNDEIFGVYKPYFWKKTRDYIKDIIIPSIFINVYVSIFCLWMAFLFTEQFIGVIICSAIMLGTTLLLMRKHN